MQISATGSRLFLFGGEASPSDSHFGYGEPVDSALYSLDLDSEKPLSWTETLAERAPSSRLGHGQAVLRHPDGQTFLYVFGGRQPEAPGTVYDGNEEIASLNDMHRIRIDGWEEGGHPGHCWEEVACTGDVPSARSYLSLIALGTDLYLYGGMTDETRYSDLYRFRALDNAWQRLPQGPMEGRGGAGVCAHAGTRSIWVVGGFCGHPVGDVWEFDGSQWKEHDSLKLPTPRSIFAGPVVLNDTFPFLMFGGELENKGQTAYDETGEYGHGESGQYSAQTLRLERGGASHVTTVGTIPAARGWTAGCRVQYGHRLSFAVFGGIREGDASLGEPAGVRLGDLHVLVPEAGQEEVCESRL